MAMSYQISLRWCVRVIAFMVESEQVVNAQPHWWFMQLQQVQQIQDRCIFAASAA
jgi:hypothetical protein